MKPFISTEETPLIGYRHFLQGDISGIQEFIFNTKSEGAAKTLKARSYFVQALSDLCIHVIEEKLGSNGCMLFYNGGGNFYVFCKDISDANLNDLRNAVQKYLKEIEIYLNISKTDLYPDDFVRTWEAIHAQSNEDKLRKFFEFPNALDYRERYSADKERQPNFWKRFSDNFVKNYSSKGFSINTPPKIGQHLVQEDGFTIFERMLALDDDGIQYKDSIVNKLPQWKTGFRQNNDLKSIIAYLDERNLREDNREIEVGDIIDFEALGRFAALRTGTDKIAALKLDVDNLGKLFKNASGWDDAFIKSNTLKEFFDEEVLRLWMGQFDGHDYAQNLYIVFSGGDDCMVIGAWDAVFQFANLVRTAFEQLIQSKKFDKPTTLSAGIVMGDSKYPVVRMATLAEEAIGKAKGFFKPLDKQSEMQETDFNPCEKRIFPKDSITVFNRVITWTDFRDAASFADNLSKIIKEDGERRSFLHRFQNTHLAFEKMHNDALQKGTIRNPEIWRLEYYLARRKEDIGKELLKDLIEKYQKILLKAVTNKQPTDLANLYPVAARWAEFLTRRLV